MSQVEYREGHNRMEALLGDEILGTARRSTHQDDDWIGWLIEVAGEMEDAPTRIDARLALRAKVEWLLDQRATAATVSALLES